MELTTILNLCHHHRGFVYYHARFGSDKKSVEVNVRPRAGSAAVCSGCHKPAPGYDHLPERRFEFIPVWGFLVFFLYSMRRVQCRHCGVVVEEEVPWSDGKHQLTKAYMLFLARWARKLSWQETAEAFHTSWEKVCFAVEYVVGWGLEHRTLEPIRAIGVDEIQYAKGHKYLTLVYQIDQGIIRLLWVGRERTKESFQQFFTFIGKELAAQIEFVCSDMWQPYLDVIRHNCSQALHILDRFHVEAVQDVQRLRTIVADHIQVGLPHIRAHELDLCSQFFSNEGEKLLEGFLGAFPADPQQADDPLVDLVDQRQIFVAFGVLDFIHADGADRFQRAMLQTPADHILDGEAHLLPGSVERLGGFLPGKLARPAGQKQHVGFGQLVLPIAPRNLFNQHRATMAALDAAHTVKEKDQSSPEGDEFEAPLGKVIVARRRLVAPGADRRRSGPRPDVHLDAFLVGAETSMLVDESPMVVAVV